MRLSVIVPAFNEQAYLAPTLDSIEESAAHLHASSGVEVETIVVDNNSPDETAAVARSRGATVVREPVQGIARARNTGARRATGDVLVFVDADVTVPRTLLGAIHAAMQDPACVGGAVDVEYRPRRFAIGLYLRAWRLLSRLTGMAQGATQFCRRHAFEHIGGYNESVWMGEDVDFFSSLRRLARDTGRSSRLIRDPRVWPSCRRFDDWPVWKILIWTNPFLIALLRRRKAFWRGWYVHPVR